MSFTIDELENRIIAYQDKLQRLRALEVTGTSTFYKTVEKVEQDFYNIGNARDTTIFVIRDRINVVKSLINLHSVPSISADSRVNVIGSSECDRSEAMKQSDDNPVLTSIMCQMIDGVNKETDFDSLTRAYLANLLFELLDFPKNYRQDDVGWTIFHYSGIAFVSSDTLTFLILISSAILGATVSAARGRRRSPFGGFVFAVCAALIVYALTRNGGGTINVVNTETLYSTPIGYVFFGLLSGFYAERLFRYFDSLVDRTLAEDPREKRNASGISQKEVITRDTGESDRKSSVN